LQNIGSELLKRLFDANEVEELEENVSEDGSFEMSYEDEMKKTLSDNWGKVDSSKRTNNLNLIQKDLRYYESFNKKTPSLEQLLMQYSSNIDTK
jgi:hypothetical protein